MSNFYPLIFFSRPTRPKPRHDLKYEMLYYMRTADSLRRAVLMFESVGDYDPTLR